MVTSLARQSIILKCLRRKSVLVGNYEFYYAAGLLKKAFQLNVNQNMKPQEICDIILEAIPGLQTEDENLQYLLRMLSIYEPSELYDEQMKELFRWGTAEPDLWRVETRHAGTEF